MVARAAVVALALALAAPAAALAQAAGLPAAVEALQAGRFAEAQRLAAEVVAREPENREALRVLAFAALRNEDYRVAADAAERFLRGGSDPDVRMVLARAREGLGDVAAAREIYGAIAVTPGDPYAEAAGVALGNLERALAQLQGQRGFFPRPLGLSGLASFGIEYDSNIANFTAPNATTATGIADTRAVVTARLEYNHGIGERWFAGGSGLYYTQRYFNDGRPFDVELGRPEVHVGLVGEGWISRVSFEYDYVEEGREKNLVTYRGQASHIHLINDWWAVVLIGSVARDDFVDPQEEAWRYDFNLQNRFYIAQPWLQPGTFLKIGYRYRYNDVDDTSGPFGYSFNAPTGGFYAPLPWYDLYFDANFSYEFREYFQPQPTSRDDDTLEFSFILGRKWTEHISTDLTFRRLLDDSTVSAFSRKQYVWGLTVAYSF